MSYSYKCYSDTKDFMKKFVNAEEGAIIYGISKSRIIVIAREAGAVYKVGNSALINTELFEKYLERFREPARELPSVINGFNDMLQHFSKYALTDEKDLQGDKTKGEDTYTGSYTADYEDFNDKEYIFGGTALERDKGSELTVTYELTVDSGTARLYWLDKGEEKVIADTSKNGTYSVTLDEGDNYLTLEGNDFCGSLKVVVE